MSSPSGGGGSLRGRSPRQGSGGAFGSKVESAGGGVSSRRWEGGGRHRGAGRCQRGKTGFGGRNSSTKSSKNATKRPRNMLSLVQFGVPQMGV